MQGTIVGVLRGGPSFEHEVSLKSGQAVLAHLSRDRFTVRDIYIDRANVWHERGLPTTPARVLPSIDVAIIALHGAFAEDGEIQKILERYGVPYTGSTSFASFVAMHKVLAKEKAREAGLKVPKYRFVEQSSDLDTIVHEIARTFSQPVVVKPSNGSASFGVTLETGYERVHTAATGLLRNNAKGVLIEEYIRGTEASVGVVEGLRGEKVYAFPPTEILLQREDPFPFTPNQYESGIVQVLCPGRFPRQVTDELQKSAQKMHDILGLKHYSRSDFIVSPRGIYYLETNTLPSLAPTSRTTQALAAVGVSFEAFLSHLLDLALSERRGYSLKTMGR